MSTADPPFWKTKTLDEMSSQEWESLCDGCGRCCLVKLEDEDTGTCYLTRLACSLLDIGSCRCSDYPNRKARMSDCVTIDPASVRKLEWLPETCAYRLVEEGRDLFWWHPLISGSPETVHAAGVSVRELARSEKGVKLSAMQRFIIGPADHGVASRKATARKPARRRAQS